MIGKTDKITSPFSIAEARSLVKDLFPPNLAIYWTDFLGTYFLGIFCFQRVRGGPLWVPHQGWTGQWSQVTWFLASCLLFYRAAMFIHELVHQRNDHMSQFRHAWNLLCGIPFLMPLFVYYPHIDHHRRSHYGTHHDGEYLPLAHFRVFFLVFYLSWSFIIPILAVFRFLILTPVAWVFPAVRTWVHARCSTMVMDPSYIRPLPSPRVLQEIRWQEACCFAWCWGVAVVPPLVLGHSSLPFVIHAYLTGVVIVLLNSIRTLGAHRWSNQGGEMTYVEQLLDSVNYPHHVWLSEF
ncbi:MAG: fatty acid desaturase [Planctomycetota bacterium]|nr:fatty acid desaturase [Planctomycetota bacterium]MDA1180635.1 fatty acid desaturase [Planctomycetota bacterium]